MLLNSSNMADGNCVIRFDDKTPSIGNIGKVVRGDTNSNIITFEMPRYHDGEDLKDKSIRIIVKSSAGVYTEDACDIRCSNNLIRFCWLLSSADTSYGNITVAIEVYGISSSEREYSLHTLPFELEIEDGLRASDSVVEIPEDWFSITDGKIGQLQALAHKHENLETLDKFDETDNGELLFNGSTIVSGDTIQVDDLGEPTEESLGKIYQYTGETTENYTHGYFYECVEVYTEYGYFVGYEWKSLQTYSSSSTVTRDSIQVEELPEQTEEHLGEIYQYIGETTDDYIHGIFYECVEVYNEYGYLIAYEWQPLETTIERDLADYCLKTELENHAMSTTHITQGERTYWNAKADKTDVPKKVSDLEDDVNLDDIHSHENQDILDLFSESETGALLYNGASIASSAVPISSEEGNIITSVEDGLYASVDLSDYVTLDYLDDLGLDDVIKNSHKHTNKDTVLDKLGTSNGKLTYNNKYVGGELSENLYNSLTLGTDGGLYYKGHTHDNLDYLDEIGEDEDGNLTYKGSRVGFDISSEDGNIVELKEDGLYAEIKISEEDYNIAELKEDGLYANTKISSTTSNIIKQKDDGIYAKMEVSAEEGNLLKLKTDGLYAPSSSVSISAESSNIIEQKTDGLFAEIAISQQEYNVATLKDDGLFIPASSATVSDKDGNIITSENDGLYAKIEISEEANNVIELKDDGLYSKISLSAEDGNIIKLKDDGLFAEHNILKVNNVSPNADKIIKLTLDDVPDGDERILYKLEDRNISASYDGATNKIITSRYLQENFVNKLEILDNLGENEKGKLTFNDEDVASANVSISSESDNIIEMKTDGLYATVDLSEYAKSDDIEDDYLKKKDAGQTYMALADYTDYDPENPESPLHTKEILGNKIKPQTLDYMNLDNVGELDGASIEQKLLEHLRNTLMHNIGNLSSILIANTEWTNGTLTNLVQTDDGSIELVQTGYEETTGKKTYTLELATFVSKIYDVGEVTSFQIITYDAIFNPYLSNIFFYVRTGTTVTYSADTWTDWVDVTDTKDISNISTRYIQLKLEMNTANMYKNIKVNYVQIFFGTDIESEVANARTDIEGTKHPSLKARLDNIETKLFDLNLITEEETEELAEELSFLFTDE